MNRKFLINSILIFVVSLAIQGCYLEASILDADYDFSAIDSKINNWVGKGYYPGASIIIVKDDNVVFEQFYGDYKPDTEVYIASAGKWMASATIAAVVDDGKLSWKDPVSKWLPEFDGVKGKATLNELLSHTSGYPDYHKPPHERDTYQSLSKSVEEIVTLKSVYEPGTHFMYGGLAMQVAGRIAELASGMKFEELFQEKISRPLDMNNTHFIPVNSEAGHAPMLGGGARCIIGDYIEFLGMIHNEGLYSGKRILTKESIKHMQADHVGDASIKIPEFVERVRGNTHNGIYGLGLWREQLNEQDEAVMVSSPSWAGAYPWIDKVENMYGFFLAHIDVEDTEADGFLPFYSSPILAVMARQAVNDTGNSCVVENGYVDVGDADLYYEKAGVGTPVVLIHAHSVDRRMWNMQFNELAKDYQVIRYDLRGYGFSDIPQTNQNFMHVEDLVALMDHLEIPKAHLVGLSLGGFIVIDALATCPERMLSGIASGGTIYPMPGPDKPVSNKEKQKRYKEIRELREIGMACYKQKWTEALLDSAGKNADRIEPLLSKMIQDWSGWQPLNVEPRLLLGTSVLNKLKQQEMDVPVMVMLGENESHGAYESAAEFMKVVPSAKQVIVNDAGHMCNMEKPEEFLNLILEFFNTH